MLTVQKRKFAVALISGMSQKDAAIKAGYSVESARSKGLQPAKGPEVITLISRKKKEVIETDDVPTYGKKVYTPAVNSPQKTEGAAVPAEGLAVVSQFDGPLQFPTTVMNDSAEEIDVRKDAAKAMLPYIHPKKGETGKKDTRSAAAKVAAGKGKFGAMASPKLVVNNKG